MYSILLLLLAGAAWWGMRQSQRGVAWGQPVTVGAALAAVVLVFLQLFPDNPPAEVMGERVDGFAYAAGVGLGRHLASDFPKARVRVLQRRVGMGLSANAMADGLEKELRDKVQSMERIRVSGPKPPPGEGRDAEEEPSIPVATLREALQDVDEKVDLLVFLFQPPPKLLAAWETHGEGKPALAVACNDVTPLFDPLGDSVIAAALAQRPDAKLHKNGRLIAPPSDPMKAFALCFEILTPETVGAYMDRYPYLVP